MTRLAFYNDTMVAYLVTCSASGKQYVGITSGRLGVRWRGHIERSRRQRPRSALSLAIRKYGEGLFTVEPIACARTRDDLCAIEPALIRQWGTMAPAGYNLTTGGEGVPGFRHDPAMVARLAAQKRGRRHTDEARRKISAAQIGRRQPDSMRQKLSAARKGKPLSAEHRAKLAAAKLGKKRPPHSAEHRAKICEGLRRAHARRREAAANA